MPSPGPAVRILLIRSWLHKLAPVRERLVAAGIAARFIRVDIEPALNAALVRGGLDVIIYDPASVAIARDTVLARCKQHRPEVPLIELGDLDDLAARITAAREALRN